MPRKPKASSASSAAALSRAGIGVSGFVGFDAFQNGQGAAEGCLTAAASQEFASGGVAAVSVNSFYNGSDEALRGAFKAVSKKDSLTKSKGFQELSELAATLPKDVIREATPHFVFHLQRTSARGDHRAREKAILALNAFYSSIPKLMRRMLPLFLVEVILALGDSTNIEVSMAASSFLDLADVTDEMFQTEHRRALADPVGKALQASIFPPKSSDSKEEERLVRIQHSALNGVALFARRLGKTDSAQEILQHAMGDKPNFKALFLNRSEVVRGKAYELTIALAQFGILNLSENEKMAQDLISWTLKAIEYESEPRQVGIAMETCVTFMQVFREGDVFFELTGDFRKNFFPRIWNLLRKGCRGAGESVYSLLLPLLSLIPEFVWHEMGDNLFAEKWLEEIWSATAEPGLLGAHGMPSLLRAQLESSAFLVKSGKHVEVGLLMKPILFFVTEPQRFRVGKDTENAVALLLRQIPDEHEIWPELTRTLLQLSMQDGTQVERVAKIIAALPKRMDSTQPQKMIDAIAKCSASSQSMIAVDLLLCRCSVEARPDAVIVLEHAKSFLRDCQQCSFALSVSLQILCYFTFDWSAFLEGNLHRNGLLNKPLADALTRVFGGSGHGALDLVVNIVKEYPTTRTVQTLLDLKWLETSSCKEMANSLKNRVDAFQIRFLEGKTTDAECEDIMHDLGALGVLFQNVVQTDDEASASIFIAKGLLDPSSVIQSGGGAVKSRLISLFEETSLAWPDNAVYAWASLARQYVYLFNDLRKTTHYARLIRVCMDISDEEARSNLLGYSEPVDLLTLLLVNCTSEEETDWRDAILLPYILQVRLNEFINFVCCELKDNDEMLGEPVRLVLRGARFYCGFNELASALKEAWDRGFSRLGLEVVIEELDDVMAELGLLRVIGDACAIKIGERAPEKARMDAEAIAEEFSTILASEEEEEDAHQSTSEELQQEKEPKEERDEKGTSAQLLQPKFNDTDEVFYTDKHGDRVLGIIRAVHTDDQNGAYYTIYFPSQDRELQTEESKLEPRFRKPETLQELNEMLARARRAGNHKESLRLMKFQPGLLPKPVDSDVAKRESMAAAKRRRAKALESIAQRRRDDSLRKQAPSTNASTFENCEQGAPADSDNQTFSIESGDLLHRFAIALHPIRRVPLEPPETKNLVLVASLLEALLPMKAIAARLRLQGVDEKFEREFLGVLKFLQSLLAHIPGEALPETVQLYVERCLTACLSRGISNWTFAKEAANAATQLDEEDPLLESIAEKNFDAVVQSLSTPGKYPSSGMIRLLKSVPVDVVAERELAASTSMLFLALDAAREVVDDGFIPLFRSCIQNDAELARKWAALIPFLAERISSGSELFRYAEWLLILSIVRKLRKLDLADALEVTQSISEKDLVTRSLRFGLFEEFPNDENSKWRLAVAIETMRVLPSLARKWFTDSSSVSRQDFTRIKSRMARYITPVIVKEEFDEINAAVRDGAFETSETEGAEEEDFEPGLLTVNTSIILRSVTVRFDKEECVAELRIVLPRIFPLELVEINSGRETGISDAKLRLWIKQINILLTNQDGNLLDALLLWKVRIEKEFQGLEPCPICHMVSHVQDSTLPKLRCSTCRNAYHSNCLVKWFRTSHQNNCPMCKQPM